MKVQGFSHVTINVSELQRSLDFYVGKLGMELRHRGRKDAYLEWGSAWICLIERADYGPMDAERVGTDHIAFFIPETNFDEAVRQLRELGIPIVREPVARGIGRAINFLDPDGTELELHTSTLEERLTVWK